MTAESAPSSLFLRVKESFLASAGEIVFGMSDGVVSIFGVVAGVAAGAQGGNIILLAGATAAIAATVSMMAGVYLDLESEKDTARVEAEQKEKEISHDPGQAVERVILLLGKTGLSERSLTSIREDLTKNPLAIRTFEDTVACDDEPLSQKVTPVVHACWMGIADFIAAMTPVVPFAFLPVEEAKITCVAGTAVLLLLLGVGRARIGKRPVARTVLETMAIATAAGIAGVVVGWLLT